jgi:hypothetical protein
MLYVIFIRASCSYKYLRIRYFNPCIDPRILFASSPWFSSLPSFSCFLIWFWLIIFGHLTVFHESLRGRPGRFSYTGSWSSSQPSFFQNKTLAADLRLLSHISKAVPQHTYGGAEGERMYSSYSFTTSALDGGECSASRSGRSLHRGKYPCYPLYRRLGGPQSRSGQRG